MPDNGSNKQEPAGDNKMEKPPTHTENTMVHNWSVLDEQT